MKLKKISTPIQVSSWFSLLIFGLAFVLPQPAAAFTFTKNLLISDAEMTNSNYLTTSGIESFLQEKGSVLAGYVTRDIDGHDRTVAGIIRNAAQKYALNPMLFLVMAQKESSAITSGSMSYAIEHWILGFGRCDSCSEAQAAPYRGIAKQFDSAGNRIRNGYLSELASRGHTVSGWGPGITKTTIDGIAVTPENNATAALYTYNPCVGAYGGGYPNFGCNSAFQKLWQEWNPNVVRYPNGTLLQIGEVVYLIQNGEKRAFTSYSALVANYDPRKIISVPAIAGEQYKNGAPITFPNYALLRSPQGTIYVLVDGMKRGIASQDAFWSLGFNPEEVLNVEWREIDRIPEGAPITVVTQYPTGALLQNPGTGAVIYVGPNGRKHDIWAREVLENNFSGREIIRSSPAEIDQFKQGKPVKLKDGTLAVSPGDPAVYVIANGRKRPIKNQKTFETFGYRWENIVRVPDSVLQLHEKGSFIKLGDKKETAKLEATVSTKSATVEVTPEPINAPVTETPKQASPVPTPGQ